MRIWLLGCEQETNRKLAIEGGAARVGMSFHSLLPRLPKNSDYSVAERFPDHLAVYLASGGHTLAQKSSEVLSSFAQCHYDFVKLNAHRLDLVTEIDDARVPIETRADYRFLLGPKFAPVWLEGRDDLDELASEYPIVAIRSDTLRSFPKVANRLRPLSSRYGVQWHLLDGARPDDLMGARVHSAATTAWLAPMRNGETIVWDGVKMQRYPKRMAEQARRRHRAQFTQAGFDADEILGGDYRETTRYTVNAFLSLETYLSRRSGEPPSTNPFRVVGADETIELPTTTPGHQTGIGQEGAPPTVDSSAVAVRNEMRAPTKRDEPPKMLPVFGLDVSTTSEITPGGETVEVHRGILRSSDQSLRQCDSCAVAATCPAFQPGAECGLGIPVDLRTKDQLFGSAVALLEMQMQRVGFMRYQEELNGGYADPNTSAEIDRWYRMVEKLKELQENKESIKFQIEAKTGGGVLTALFGERAATLRQLDTPIPSDNIIDVIAGDDD